MARRLDIIPKDAEYREIQRATRSRRMSITAWVRQTLELARHQEPLGSASKKLEINQVAARHQCPLADIASGLAEIEAGYTIGARL